VAPVRFPGVLTAAESVDIAPRVAGLLARVHVRAGDAVEVGQLVAEMDPAQSREELRAAEAALAASSAAYRQAVVDVADAKRKLDVETKAVEAGVSPAQNLEEARLSVLRAEASAQRARAAQAAEAARTQTVRDHLDDTQLRSPSTGTVALRYRDPGNRIEAGAAILRIVGQGSVRLRFAVPPQLVQSVPVGRRVTAQIDTIAAPLTGSVKHVAPTIDPASGLVIVEAELTSDATSALRPGLGGWVTL
jgi:RND family efflux transporter MFP subunit